VCALYKRSLPGEKPPTNQPKKQTNKQTKKKQATTTKQLKKTKK